MNLQALFVSCSRVCRNITPTLFDHLWQSSLFACVLCVLAVGLRRYPAQTRYWVWLAGSAKFLMPFALLIGLGSQMGRSTQTKAGLYATLDVASQPFTEMAIRNAPQHVIATATDSQISMALLPMLLVAVWGCGFAGMLLFWLMQRRQVNRIARDAELQHEGREMETLQRLEWAFRHAGSLDILVAHHAMEPGVVGMIHPVLLWPAGLSSRLDDSQLEAILIHELCHVRRRDNLTSAIQMLVASLFWFHPLVWWFGARLIEERELACDEEVLRRSEPTVYAKSILAVCEFCVEPSPICVSGITGADLKNRVNRIMTDRVHNRLGRLAKALLLVLSFAAFAAPISFGLMHGRIPLYGQILHPSGPLPSFEVATIKLMQPGYTPPFNPASRAMIHIGSIKQLIGLAYNLPPLSVTQIIGAPDWAGKDKYVVQSQIEAAMNERLHKMSPAQSQVQRQLMLQSLLADRLHLKVHFETRELPMYAMVIAKGGSKLRPSKEIPDATDTMLPPPMAPGTAPSLSEVRKGFFAYLNGSTFEMQAKALSLDELAQMLQRQPDAGGRLIVNQTGISGFFDSTMKWTTEMQTTPMGERPPDSDEPPFFTAIREQLGLRLVPTKGPAEVIVIDHIERPSEN